MSTQEKVTRRPPIIKVFGANDAIKTGLSLTEALSRKDRFSHPIFFYLTPLPPGQLIPAAEDFVKGKIIDWSSKQALAQTGTSIGDPNNPLDRVIRTALDYPNEEGERALDILQRDLASFTPNTALLGSPKMREFLCKLVFSINTHPDFAQRQHVDHGQQNPAAKRYVKTIGDRLSALDRTVESFSLADINSFTTLIDAFHDITEHLRVHKRNPKKISNFDLSGKEAFLESYNALKEREREFWGRISDIIFDKASDLKKGWGWEEIEKVLDILPTITSSLTIRQFVSPGLTKALSESELPKQSRPLRLNREGILTLLKMRWIKDSVLKKEVIDDIKNDPEFLKLGIKPVNIPKYMRYFPILAANLLDRARAVMDQKDFQDMISNIHALAKNDQEAQVSWILTLIGLKLRNPELGPFVNEIFEEWKELSQSTRKAALSDETSGLLKLTRSGRLEVTKRRESEASGANESLPALDLPPSKDLIIGINKLIEVPLLDQAGIVPYEQVEDVVKRIFERKADALDPDLLLSDFEKRASAWQKRSDYHKRRLLFLGKLNALDREIQQGVKRGINAVFVEGERIFFVLSPEVAQVKSEEQTLPAVITGRLDKSGELKIEGIGDNFIGEPEHLFLNNLALHLATQSLHGGGKIDESEKDLMRELNGIISGWNKSSWRGDLPKISRNGKNQHIAVTLQGCKEPVLVGEA